MKGMRDYFLSPAVQANAQLTVSNLPNEDGISEEDNALYFELAGSSEEETELDLNQFNGSHSVSDLLSSINDADFHQQSEDIFASASLNFWLPAHIRCAAHSLNLLATTDVDRILDSSVCSVFKLLFQRSMKKVADLWKSSNASTKARDLTHSILGIYSFH